MKKRVFVVHRWEGGPNKDWLPWAKRELSPKGYEVHLLSMPTPEHPKIETWVPYLAKAIGEPSKNTILIGHSIGCQTILRYLESLPKGRGVAKVILVAGSGSYLTGLTDEEKLVAKPWLETPIDLSTVRTKANDFVAIFSDNDPYVPLEENAKTYKEKLGAEIIIKHNMGHFEGDDGVTELPIVLDSVLKLVKERPFIK